MELNEYHKLAMRTDDPAKYNEPINRLINGVMGLNGESGEVIDILKKALFQGHELKKDKLVEELGDVLWYIVECVDTIGMTLEDVANANILKLVKRFPDGFSKEASIERKDIDNSGDGYANGEPVMPEMRDEPGCEC